MPQLDGAFIEQYRPDGPCVLRQAPAWWAAAIDRLAADRATFREADELRRAVAAAGGTPEWRRVTVSPALAARVLGMDITP